MPSSNLGSSRFFKGWIVLICCFCMTFTIGLQSAFSDFFLPLSKQFGWNYATVSTIGSVSFIAFAFGTIIGALVISRVGTRNTSYLGTLMLVGGIVVSSAATNFWELLIPLACIAGLGSAFVTIVATTLTVKWFVKMRGFAVGVMTAGAALGALVIPPVGEYFIVLTSWQMTLLFLGMGFLILLVATSYFMRTPDQMSVKPYGWQQIKKDHQVLVKDYTLKEASRTAPFWLIYCMMFLAGLATLMFTVHAIPFGESHGISEIFGADALSFYGAGSLLARLGLGVLSDKLSRINGLVVAFLIETIALLSLPFIGSNVTLFLACALGVGFGYGGFFADSISLTGDVFGASSIDRIWSLYETAWGLGGLSGPILAGLYFDAYSTYGGVFEGAAVGSTLAIVLCILLSKRIDMMRPSVSTAKQS